MTSNTSPLNFAPYSDPPPLPRWTQGSSTPSTSTNPASYQEGAPISSLSGGHSFSSVGYSSSTGNVSGMETTLPYDLGWLAVACYALGPFGAAIILLTEFESDYLRFHAYQSALLSAVYLVVDFLSWMLIGLKAVQWLLILGQVGSFVLLSMRAYRDTDLLDRYYVPLLGKLAEGWVAEE